MPDRMIRDELLESERWLSLKDNADRLAFVALLLRADALGDFSAEPFRLMRLWRDFGINTPALVQKTLSELSDADLIRLYNSQEQPPRAYLHIPRFGQRLRHLKRVFPPSPWTTNEQKQRLEKEKTDASLTQDCLASAEVKGSEVTTPTKQAPDPRNNAAWLAFSDAYAKRYGVAPVRNASVNTCMANLVKRLGDEAAPVAAFYLTHNDSFYIKKQHSAKQLLADCEGLRTQWKRGRKVTGLEARSAEQKDAVLEQIKRLNGD